MNKLNTIKTVKQYGNIECTITASGRILAHDIFRFISDDFRVDGVEYVDITDLSRKDIMEWLGY